MFLLLFPELNLPLKLSINLLNKGFICIFLKSKIYPLFHIPNTHMRYNNGVFQHFSTLCKFVLAYTMEIWCNAKKDKGF